MNDEEKAEAAVQAVVIDSVARVVFAAVVAVPERGYLWGTGEWDDLSPAAKQTVCDFVRARFDESAPDPVAPTEKLAAAVADAALEAFDEFFEKAGFTDDDNDLTDNDD